MAVMLLQLSLCVLTVVQLTSSQSTYQYGSLSEQENDVYRCGRTEQTCSQLIAAVLQLQKDVAEVKATNHQKDMKGTLV